MTIVAVAITIAATTPQQKPDRRDRIFRRQTGPHNIDNGRDPVLVTVADDFVDCFEVFLFSAPKVGLRVLLELVEVVLRRVSIGMVRFYSGVVVVGIVLLRLLRLLNRCKITLLGHLGLTE